MNESGRLNLKRAEIAAFFLCFFAVGIPFWIIPYSQVNLPNAFYGMGVVVVFIVAVLLSATSQTNFSRALLVPGLAFPAVLMVRVVIEGFIDPSRHNLWPFALIIALVMGIAVSGAGAFVGWLAARVWGSFRP